MIGIRMLYEMMNILFRTPQLRCVLLKASMYIHILKAPAFVIEAQKLVHNKNGYLDLQHQI